MASFIPFVRRGRLLATLVIGGILPVAACSDTADAPSAVDDAIDPRPQDERADDTPGQASQSVTLITGDRVLLSPSNRVRVFPAKGREKIAFSIEREGDHIHVVPSDAAVGVASGKLDPLLFDVTKLVEFGYGDAKRKDIPVLVTYEHASAFAAAKAAPPPSTVRRALASVHGLAMAPAKRDGARFWSNISAGVGSPSATSGVGQQGIKKVWLDGQVRLTLAQSVPQVGAPAAWAAGYRGTGVKVGILDSGIDATHPDLASRVVAAADFTDDGDQLDRAGHGTHVASTVAGTGAASSGQYTGVAPEARLIDAKVCDRYANCTYSDILEGMDWAIQQGAKVINMSLGGQNGPGMDPLEEAVERLTAQNGVLFVISAGNEGSWRTPESISSPGSSPSALTVGAVNTDETVASFSSRGPLPDTGAIKPDITAPGGAINAARSSSAGGDANNRYWVKGGTSMAAPHAAGAAAILLQEHPTWTPAEIKAAIIGSATPNSTLGAYDQGSGRLSLGKAIAATTTVDPPSVGFPRAMWPHADDTPQSRTLTYRSKGTSAITYTLALSVRAPGGGTTPAGMFTLDKTSITVPANGTAQVTVTVDPRVSGPDGEYSADLVATPGTAGAADIRTAIAIDKEVESYSLTLNHLDRDGFVTGLYSDVLYMLRPDGVNVRRWTPYGIGGSVTLRLPRGRYVLQSWNTPDEPLKSAILVEPALDLTGDTTINLDGRLASPVTITVPKASARAAETTVSYINNSPGVAQTWTLPANFVANTAHLGPNVATTAFISEVAAGFAEPGTDGTFFNSPYVYNLAWYDRGHFLTGGTRQVTTNQLATVNSRYAAQTAVQRYGRKYEAAKPSDWANYGGASELGISLAFSLPFTRTEYYLASGVLWTGEYGEVPSIDVPSLNYSRTPISSYTANTTTQTRWNVGPFAPVMKVRDYGSSPAANRSGDQFFFDIPMFGDQHGHPARAPTDTARTALYMGTQLITEQPTAGFLITNAPGALATYKLTVDATRSIGTDYATRTSTAWTFKSQTAPAGTNLPFLSPRFTPNLDDRNKAAAGASFTLPLAVDRYPGSASSTIQKPTVRVSYNDGTTWQAVTVSTASGGWTMNVQHPASAQFVSLYVKATDQAGNIVEETIIRAYGLR